MTNKVICAEKLKAWAAERLAFYESHEREPLYESGLEVIKELITEINSGRLSPSPAPAEGVISTVTNCPTCGAECTVEGKTTHYYVPRTAPSAPWIPVSERLPEPRDEDYLVVVRNKNKDDGIFLFDVGNFTSDGTWAKSNTWEDVTHWMPLLPTPTTNTRE